MRRFSFILFCLSLTCAGASASATSKTIHVFVALCDNESQGIVPVPPKLGNGNDPANNLYWGALYGVKAYLRRSPEWTLVSSRDNPTSNVLERCVFRHRSGSAYLIADAYRGSTIKQTVQDFLHAAAGRGAKTLKVDKAVLGLHGRAQLVVYVGHNGLMDFRLAETKRAAASTARRDAIVLACKSKTYFRERLLALGCRPLLLTTGFMAPEAYTLDRALEGWLAGERGEPLRKRAAQAYHKYQKCGMTNALRLFYADE
ncbi:hypothetical protein ACFL34_02625 [Candidatus Sumerlaeota bacterium]